MTKKILIKPPKILSNTVKNIDIDDIDLTPVAIGAIIGNVVFPGLGGIALEA